MNLQQQRIIQFFKHIAGQKFTWFASLMVFLTVTAFNTRPEDVPSTKEDAFVSSPTVAADIPPAPAKNTDEDLPHLEKASPASEPLEDTTLNIKPTAQKKSNKLKSKTAKLIAYARSFMGTPYVYGGTSPKGFDCSGYVYHIFSKFGFDINRSSRSQSIQGNKVAVEEVQPGDVLFFTGTNPEERSVGHVGIVISDPGEPVTFIHSSSNGGVKVSELEGYYDTRFMFAKRMN
ncbi:C40 family peptidase [Cesiribacter sp. SM1]|uniref:C40 family peptidase n=1 Tax=Cesiribacter sp. SM1 TaxID=2861196 RepID=UPI001CD347F8|nr:C40 family peptidase [Cesiribacter sp. SM1]